MDPIAYATSLNAFYRSQGFPRYRWTVNVNEAAPALARRLHAERVDAFVLVPG